jgi:hypothetical protein
MGREVALSNEVINIIPRREWDEHRKIVGLQSAFPLASKPSHITALRRKGGSKGKGLTYEKQVGRWLKRQGWAPVTGQWFSFRDRNGYGCAQTDHLLFLANQVVVVECKLTETWVGFSQIDFLYRPILEFIYGLPVTGVMACKHLTTRQNPRLRTELEDCLASPGANFVWQHLP